MDVVSEIKGLCGKPYVNVSSMKFNRLNIRKIAKVFVNLEEQKTPPPKKNKDSRYVDRQ